MYIFGHKIPDSDSIIGAISLAYLQNQLNNEAIASRVGEINPESGYILDKFNLDEPIFKDSYANEEVFLVDYSVLANRRLMH